jgi:hypothetical protein
MLERVARVPIRAGWSDVPSSAPDIVREWRAAAAGNGARVVIRQRTRDYEVFAAAPPGSHLRRRRREICPTLPAARQQARAWLVQVVAGQPL